MYRRIATVAVLAGLAAVVWAGPPQLGGALGVPLPLFPSTNWWNLDISAAPVDPNSAAYLPFMGGATRALHPDFGGTVDPGSTEIYGFPYIVVDGTQPKQTVQFDFSDESDGVDHNTDTSFPFYPIPAEAITQDHWIEEGHPGNVDLRADSDRHMLIVDKTSNHLYELYNVFYDGSTWNAGSGAFFDMNTNDRRPEGWTSADAAGLAILPGLVRHDEVYGTAEIGHAFRVTVSSTNGHVYPASHTAGSTAGALPMGARLRLKADTDLSGQPAEMQRIFRAMKKYGLIVADNGSNMYVSGTFDTQWDNGILNPAFGSLHASDFEVIQLGYNPPAFGFSINDTSVTEGNSGTTAATFTVTVSPAPTGTVTVHYATASGTAASGVDFQPASGTLTFLSGEVSKPVVVNAIGDATDENDETFTVTLSAPTGGAGIIDGQGVGTILDDDPPPKLSIGDAIVTEGASGTTNATVTVTLASVSAKSVTVSYATADGTAMAAVSDYLPRSGTLTFPAGTTTASFTVPVVGDTVDERNEAFLVVLSSAVNATLARATGQIAILDDDGRASLCTPILIVPITITAQGNYCLVKNLSTAQATGNAITIASDFVSVNMSGFKIGGGGAGLGTQAIGVYALNRKNVAIRNGNLRGFLQAVFLQDTSGTFTASQGHLIENVRADENTLAGIHVQGRGSVVRGNQVSTTGASTALGADATTYGIFSEGPGARVLLNDVTDTVGVGTGDGVAVAITSGNGSVAERNRIGNAVLASSSGIRISGSSSVLAIGNRLAVFEAGIEYISSTGRFRDNLTSGVTVPFTGGTDAGNNE
ncbi:MAG TPA: Calx-beta domain-containing protein [Vicinamibacteria bacterium]